MTLRWKIFLKVIKKARKSDFFLAAPPSSAPFRVAIKGLPAQTTCPVILAELTSMKYDVSKVAQLTRRSTKAPTKVFMAVMSKTPGVNKILNTKVLLGLDISVEPFRSKSVPQCFNCNFFYRTSHSCHLAPRCLKCGESHQTRECSLGKFKNPTCINCKATGHVASSKKCPFPKPRRLSVPTRIIRPSIPARRKRMLSRQIGKSDLYQLQSYRPRSFHVPFPETEETFSPNPNHQAIDYGSAEENALSANWKIRLVSTAKLQAT